MDTAAQHAQAAQDALHAAEGMTGWDRSDALAEAHVHGILAVYHLLRHDGVKAG